MADATTHARSAPPAETLEEAIDTRPIGRARLASFVACGLVMVVDGYDLAAMPLAVPHLVRDWGTEASRFGLALSAVLLGLGLGAVLLAPLGDRLGRRPVISLSTLLIGLVTLATASAHSENGLIVWRLLTGIALGTCLPNATALVAELAPKRRRIGLLTLVSCGVSVGGVAAGFVVPPLARHGWQAIFVVPGAFTIVLALILVLVLPESPKLLLAKGRRAALAAVSRRLGLGDVARWVPPPGAAAASRPSLLGPLERPYRFGTFVFVGVYLLNAFALYMLNSWLPTLLPRAGFPIDQAARLTALVQGGGLVMGLLLSAFLDRGRTATTLIAAYVMVALALLAFSLVPPTPLGWGVLLLIAGGGVSGVHLAMMAVGTGFYPPQILSSAIGFAVAVARIGAIAGPLIGGLLIKAGVSPATFLAAVVLPVLACTAIVSLVPYVRRPGSQGG